MKKCLWRATFYIFLFEQVSFVIHHLDVYGVVGRITQGVFSTVHIVQVLLFTTALRILNLLTFPVSSFFSIFPDLWENTLNIFSFSFSISLSVSISFNVKL